MILKRLSTNTTEIDLGNGTTVLFSYQTPVACCVGRDSFYVTEKHHSTTTTKHINQWLGSHNAPAGVSLKPQAYFDGLVLSMQATNAREVC